jgi:lipoate-protein ligase A
VAAPCFASTTRFEIVADGGKLAGSAQRRGARALLQQTSVLLGDGHLRLTDFLRLEEPARARVREELAGASRAAGRWLEGNRSLERWAAALAARLPNAVRVNGGAGRACLLAEPG